MKEVNEAVGIREEEMGVRERELEDISAASGGTGSRSCCQQAKLRQEDEQCRKRLSIKNSILQALEILYNQI